MTYCIDGLSIHSIIITYLVHNCEFAWNKYVCICTNICCFMRYFAIACIPPLLIHIHMHPVSLVFIFSFYHNFIYFFPHLQLLLLQTNAEDWWVVGFFPLFFFFSFLCKPLYLYATCILIWKCKSDPFDRKLNVWKKIMCLRL